MARYWGIDDDGEEEDIFDELEAKPSPPEVQTERERIADALRETIRTRVEAGRAARQTRIAPEAVIEEPVTFVMTTPRARANAARQSRRAASFRQAAAEAQQARDVAMGRAGRGRGPLPGRQPAPHSQEANLPVPDTSEAPNAPSAVLEGLRWLVEQPDTRGSSRDFAQSLMDGAEHYGGLTERQFNSAKRMLFDEYGESLILAGLRDGIQAEEWVQAPRRIRAPTTQDADSVTIDATIVRESDRAYRLRFQWPAPADNPPEPLTRIEWFPKSAVQRMVDDPGKFVVAGWIARQKRLTPAAG